jgi:hypothetical protein
MRYWLSASLLAGVLYAQAQAQVAYPPIAVQAVDTSGLATKDDVANAQAAAAAAKASADAAAATAATATANVAAARSSADASVKKVGGTAPDGSGNVALPAITTCANCALTGTPTVNGAPIATSAGVTSAVAAVQALIPQPSSAMPPGVTDTGSVGTTTSVYALANHTHASRARKLRATSAADGSYTWTFATPFTTGATPVCTVTAEPPVTTTDIINAQIEGAPTATSVVIRVNRANRTVASLLGLTVLSVPASPGATPFDAICLEP